MKDASLTENVCRKFCRFYKGEKEEMRCGTYEYLKNHFTPERLLSLLNDIPSSPDLSLDREIRDHICNKCAFLVDGCDFRDGIDSPPCGGYTIVEYLFAKGLVEKK